MQFDLSKIRLTVVYAEFQIVHKKVHFSLLVVFSIDIGMFSLLTQKIILRRKAFLRQLHQKGQHKGGSMMMKGRFTLVGTTIFSVAKGSSLQSQMQFP